MGPLSVSWGDEAPRTTRDRRETRILGALLLAPNRAVSVSDLVDVLWPSAPPATARQQLQNCASALCRRLRRAGLPPLSNVANGYQVDVAWKQLDATSFERYVQDARALASTDPVAAASKFREALGLWRGQVLGGIAMGPFDASVARLQELRLSALEEQFEIALKLGKTGAVVSDLIASVQENPLREKLAALLMRALAECGRPAEAVDLFHTTRRNLVDNYGIDPSPVLTSAYAQVLGYVGPEAKPAYAAPLSQPGWRDPAARHLREAVTAALTHLEMVRAELQQVLDASSGHGDRDSQVTVQVVAGPPPTTTQSRLRRVGVQVDT